MNIRAAITAITELQGALAVTDPFKSAIKRSYKLPPDRSKTLNDLPCFINLPTLLPTRFASALLRRTYNVRMQLFVGGPLDQAADIALAFEQELLQAFAGSVTLGGACTNIETIEGELGLLQWANLGYAGLEYRLVLHMAEAQEYAP